jgi:23S rRNA (adenine2030-N6)-methyltransferase
LNYRHIFHAGNFGDVFKHVLLVPLLRAMQRKEKGFLFLDTHAGLGAYDLSSVPAGRTLEYADGIARLWSEAGLPDGLRDYVELVRRFNRERGGFDSGPHHYPGSPRLASMLLRPQDRLALSELHPDDFETLQLEFRRERGVEVQRLDGYAALRAWLPPPERRAFVLIDPPYEDPNEISRLHAGLTEALQRFPSGVYAVWYPIKDRSGSQTFKAILRTLALPPTLAVELRIFENEPPDRLNGCGLLVLNPPWQIAGELTLLAEALCDRLAVEPGARSSLEWLREED